MLRGGDAADDHPELVRLETEDDVEKLIARVQAFEAALRALPESGELFAARPRSQRRAADGDEAAVAQRAAAVEQRQSADALEALRSKGVDVRV